MWEIYFKTFFFVLLMEIGSTSQLAIATMAIHSQHPLIIWLAGISALMVSSALAIKLGRVILMIPCPINTIMGVIMLTVGIVLLWKK